MKIQCVVIDPDHLSKNSETSVLFGYVASNEALADYDTSIIAIKEVQGCNELILMRHEGENISKREGGFVDDFKSVLTSRNWRKPNPTDGIAGEITFVNSEAINKNDGYSNHYLVMSIIKGEHQLLKSLSGKLLETQSIFPGFICNSFALVDTGVEAKHTLGTYFPQIFAQPIWGFEKERMGLRHVASLAAVKHSHKVVDDFIHRDIIPEDPAFRTIKTDPVYRDYLKAKEKIDPHTFVYWENAEMRKARESIPIKALVKSLIEDSPGP